jgi:predicted acyl esterase
MRELELPEIETVSGGETRMDTVVVRGTRGSENSVYPDAWELRGMSAQELIFGQGSGGLLHQAGIPAEGVVSDSYSDDEDDDVPEVSNTFDLQNGGTTTVTGPDANGDGVVDGYEQLANDQNDIFRSGSILDDIGDALTPQPYSPPEERP